MQNKKSKVLVIALIVGLVAILSVGSLAWFTAKDEVTNTLKLADDFEIDVYETDENSAAIVDETGKTVGKTYENIMPGQTIHKDPTVKNTGTHPEWVRVNVTLSNYDIWSHVVESGADLSTIFTGFESGKWTRYDAPTVDDTAKTVTYTFYLNSKLEADATQALFTGVKIPESLTLDQAKTIGTDGFTIKVEAEAIQAENLDSAITTPQAAFALLENN